MILKSNLIVNDKKLRVNDHSFVIGVDGGGTKTLAALADVKWQKSSKLPRPGVPTRAMSVSGLRAANIAGAIFKIIKGKKKLKNNFHDGWFAGNGRGVQGPRARDYPRVKKTQRNCRDIQRPSHDRFRPAGGFQVGQAAARTGFR